MTSNLHTHRLVAPVAHHITPIVLQQQAVGQKNQSEIGLFGHDHILTKNHHFVRTTRLGQDLAIPAAPDELPTRAAAGLHHARRTSGFARLCLINWLMAGAMAFVIAAACNLDGPEDHQADWADSQALQELQASQANTARRNVAAQKLCNQARGPNSEARWLDDGSLVCTTRRGVVTANATAQVQP